MAERISVSAIVGLALRVVGKREEIAALWDRFVPLLDEIRGKDPMLGNLLTSLIKRPPHSTDAENPNPPPQDGEVYSVLWLQDSLNKLGADPQLVVDGDYGDATKKAVKDFQVKHPPLTPDGWAGVQTQAVIVEELAKL